jgi:hypothetical protein
MRVAIGFRGAVLVAVVGTPARHDSVPYGAAVTFANRKGMPACKGADARWPRHDRFVWVSTD